MVRTTAGLHADLKLGVNFLEYATAMVHCHYELHVNVNVPVNVTGYYLNYELRATLDVHANVTVYSFNLLPRLDLCASLGVHLTVRVFARFELLIKFAEHVLSGYIGRHVILPDCMFALTQRKF